jgi:DNA-binding IclR family transcriptional regulator
MMENLRALGYVRKDPHISGYWITERCQELGNGYADQQWVLDIGNKVVNRLHEETKLGVVLTTPNGENMIVRIATILRNSAGGHRTTAGTLIPMGQCCSGHSYLAHGSRDLRQNLLDDLYARAEHDKNFTPFVHNQVALKRILAEKLLDGIRTQGYAMGHAWADGSGRLGVVAVPIMRDEDVVGSLSLNFFYSSLKATALGDLLALLKNAALEIGSSAAPMRHSQAAE